MLKLKIISGLSQQLHFWCRDQVATIEFLCLVPAEWEKVRSFSDSYEVFSMKPTSLLLKILTGRWCFGLCKDRDAVTSRIVSWWSEFPFSLVIGCSKYNVCTLQITDTAGSHQFPAMQRLSIMKGNAFVLVYAVTSRQTLLELKTTVDLIRDVRRVTNADDNPPMILGDWIAWVWNTFWICITFQSEIKRMNRRKEKWARRKVFRRLSSGQLRLSLKRPPNLTEISEKCSRNCLVWRKKGHWPFHSMIPLWKGIGTKNVHSYEILYIIICILVCICHKMMAFLYKNVMTSFSLYDPPPLPLRSIHIIYFSERFYILFIISWQPRMSNHNSKTMLNIRYKN